MTISTLPVDSGRYHAFDSLRGLAMFLGIILHGSMTYTATRVPFWPITDSETTPIADLFIIVVHLFRMQLFFWLAGFFAALLLARHTLYHLIHNRVQRILVPFVLGLFFIIPILQLFWLTADKSTLKFLQLPTFYQECSFSELIENYIFTGSYVAHLNPIHLWFLYYLLIAYLMMIVLVIGLRSRLSKRITRCTDWLDRSFRHLMISRGRWLFLSIPIIITLAWSQLGFVDTPDNWNIQIHTFAHYFYFFLLGWMVYRHRDLLFHYCGKPWRQIAIANGLLLPIFLVSVGILVQGRTSTLAINQLETDSPLGESSPLSEDRSSNHLEINSEQGSSQKQISPILSEDKLKSIAVVSSSFYTFFMVHGLLSLFLQKTNRESRFVRYLAESSYWCYLIHLIPIFVFQRWFSYVDLPLGIKWGFSLIGTMVVLLISYHYLVRNTFLGVLLNGKRANSHQKLKNASGENNSKSIE